MMGDYRDVRRAITERQFRAEGEKRAAIKSGRKARTSDQLAADVAAWLAQGNEITKVAPGVSGDRFNAGAAAGGWVRQSLDGERA